MEFEQSIQESLKAAERRLAAIRRAERADERRRFSYWSTRALEQAEAAGKATPTSAELKMLKRLAEMPSPFSAAQVVRNGWCGIRSVSDAANWLERFSARGWLHPALPNREGHARYAFTREYALGDTGPVTIWPDIDPVGALVEAEFLHVSNDTDGIDNDAVAECEFEAVPDPSAEGELWNLARKLAFESGTKLHRINGCIEGLTPIQCAYAMAIAQGRVIGDAIPTPIRGVADYLGVDYNAMLAGVKVAEAAIRILNEIETGKMGPTNSDNPATPMPRIEV